jgi:OFA family oxalate/formate antiporter-like MFS transporter
MSENVGNRYLVIVGAIIVQLCLGTIYAWSVFQDVLETGSGYGWERLYTQLPFAAGLASFALFMIFAGRWQDSVGPRKVATVGGILLGAGYILASLVDTLGLGSDSVMGTAYLVITYGIIGGAGIGFAYVCPIASLVKWFPDKKGAITGVAVAGFGGGALIFLYVEQFLLALSGGYVAMPFLVLGIVYLIGVVLGAQVLSNPPVGWTPPGWTSPQSTANGASTGMTPGEIGLMTLGNVIRAAKEIDPLVNTLGLGALIGGIMSIFNAAGRIAWGALSDKIGRVTTMILMFLILALAMFSFSAIALGPNSWIVVTAVASVIGFCFGGNFALFPSATADYFGSENVGKNYGVMFTAYGIAGIVGALVAGIFGQMAGYSLAFLITGVLAIIAVVLTVILRFTRKE